MRMWRFGAVVLILTSLRSVDAQRVSPAAVVQRSAASETYRVVNQSASLGHDLRRGATIGGAVGAALGLVGVAFYAWANTRPTCCEEPPHHVRLSQILAIEGVSMAGGAVWGTMYQYGRRHDHE